MQDLFDDENYGFTEKERRRKRRSICYRIWIYFLLLLNDTYVAWFCFHRSLTETDKTTHKYWIITLFFFAFCFTFSLRLSKSLYLYRQWKLKNVDPTLKESRLEFRCLFFIGIGELVLQILAVVAWFNDYFKDLDNKITVSLIVNLIFGLYEIFTYLGKLLLIGLAYCYFKVYGGLEVTDSPDYNLFESIVRDKYTSTVERRIAQEQIENESS